MKKKEVKMSKRFTDTEKWKDDWYLSLNNDYRIVWQWLLDNCNHAGICKPSIKLLNMMCNTNLKEEELFKIFEGRLIEFKNFWFIPKFLKFQYGNLNSKKPAVVSVVNEIVKNNLINYVNDLGIITESLHNDYVTIKDKDKDKDKEKDNNNELKNSNLFRQPNIPTFEQVCHTFFQNGGTEEMATAFFNKHSGTGWFLNGSPIVNYSTLISNFINNFKKFNNAKSKSRTETTNESLDYLKELGEQLFNEYHNGNGQEDS